MLTLDDTASKLKSATKIPNRTAGTDTQHIQVEAEHIIEYEWPLKSGSYYFIQVLEENKHDSNADF